MLLKNKITCDQVKHRLETHDYLSALMDHSKNLRRNIGIYNDKLRSINSKLSMVIHTPDFIKKNLFFFSMKMKSWKFGFKKQIKHCIGYNSKC